MSIAITACSMARSSIGNGSPSSSNGTASPGRARPKTGALCTDKDAFKDMARGKHHRLLNPLREALSTLGQMRLNDLQVGADGRNRCALKPFWANTGRNQPSSSGTSSATPPGIAG